MQMRKEVFALAITGLFLIATSALALNGTDPVDVSNGIAKISCSTSNSAVVDTSGTVSCSTTIPLGVSTKTYTLVDKYFFGTVTQYDPVYCAGSGIVVSLDVVYTPTLFCGCAYNTATNGFGKIYASGETVCSKTSASIALGDRLTLDSTNGYVKTAADTEVAIGVAVEAKAGADSQVAVVLFQKSSPVASATKYVQFVTTEVAFPTGNNIDRWMAPTINGDLENAYAQNITSVSWTAGAIVNGLSCECDTAMAASREMDVLLCKDSSSCTTSSHVSYCELDGTESSCTDSSFSEVAISSGDDLFMHFKRHGGASSTGCRQVSCKFAWTQTEY